MAEPEINVVGLSNSKSNSKTNWKVISAIIGIIVLALGVIAGIILVRQNQDVREQAACVAQCPGDDNILMSCHDEAESGGGGDTLDSICNSATIGRIEICGQTASTARQYCCTTNGWKSNLTLCSTTQNATATATATATSTSTALSTATATATSTSTSQSATTTATSTSKATATSTAKSTSTSASTPAATIAGSATPFPVPETGSDWPTMVGAGLGLIMLIISLGLAL